MAQQSITLSGPDRVDTADLHFKLVKRSSVFLEYEEKPNEKFSLLAVSNTMGVTFVGSSASLLIIQTDSLGDDVIRLKEKSLPQRPSHVVINYDETYLAVGFSSPDGSRCLIFNLMQLPSQGDLTLVHEVRLSTTLGAAITDFVWNPTIPNLFASCLSDGSLMVMEMSINSVNILGTLPKEASARCFCWSPKGKQLVIGFINGELKQFQYKPQFQPAKAIPAPALYNGQVTAVGVLWISNFQFGVYYGHRSDNSIAPSFVIVNTPKNEPVSFINYDDIAYGSTCTGSYYFFHQPTWNVILVAATDGMEVNLLHSTDGKNWTYCATGDSSRAELPLNSNQEETYPWGLAVDLSSQKNVISPKNEALLSPMPRLLFLSNEGQLCLFNFISTLEGTTPICAPPTKPIPDAYFGNAVTHIAPSKSNVDIAKPAVTPQQPAPGLLPTTLSFPAEEPKKEAPPIKATPFIVPPVSAPVLPTPAQTVLKGALPVSLRNVTPPQPQTKSVVQSPQITSTPKLDKAVPSPPSVTAVKQDNSKPETGSSLPPETEAESEVDDVVYCTAIMDELNALTDELQKVLSKSADDDFKLGSEAIFQEPIQRLETLEEFLKDVDVDTIAHAEEADELKLNVLESISKVEHGRLTAARQGTPLAKQLRRNEQLDPHSAKTLHDLLVLKTHIKTQLNELSQHLDNQWEEHQRSGRERAKEEMKTPWMEDIHKTLTLHRKLIDRQKQQLNNLQKIAEKQTFYGDRQAPSNTSFNVLKDTNRSATMSKLAESLLGISISESKSLQLDENEEASELKQENSRWTDFSAEQVSLLLDRFEDAEVPVVSHALSFSEREAHKQQVAERLKAAAAQIKKKRAEKNAAKIIPIPQTDDEKVISSDKPKPAVSTAVPVPIPPSTPSLSASFGVKPPNISKITSAFSVPQSNFHSISSMIAPTTDAAKSEKFHTAAIEPEKKIGDAIKPPTIGALSFSFNPVPVVSTSANSQPAFAFKTTTSGLDVPTTAAFVSSTASTGTKPLFNQNTGFFKNSAFVPSATSSPFVPSLSSTTTPTTIFPSSQPMSTPSAKGNTPPRTTGPINLKVETTAPIQLSVTSESSVGLFKSVAVSEPFGSLNIGTTQSPLTSGNIWQAIGLKTPTTTNVTSLAEPVSSSVAQSISIGNTNVTSTTLFTPVVTSSKQEKMENPPDFSAFKGTLPSSTVVTTSAPSLSIAASTGVFSFSTTTTPLFSLTSSSKSQGSLFGVPSTTTTASTTSSTTTSEVTSTTAATTATTSIFGATSPNTSSTTSGSIFSSFATPPLNTTAIFGSAAVAKTTASIFSNSPSSTVSSSGISSPVTSAPETTTSGSLFTALKSTAETIKPLGQGSTTTATASTSVFAASTTSASTSVFGAPASVTSASSIFGTTTTTSGGLFGSSGFSTTTTTASDGFFSSFGQPTATPTRSVFGGTQSVTTSSSGFGSDLTQTTNLFSSVLGGSSLSQSGSIFGQSTPVKSPSDTSSNIFGATPASTSASIFGQSSNSIFGQSSPSNLFGTTTSSSSVFGQTSATTSSSSIFGQTPATTSTSFFGQAICSPFGSGTAAPNQNPFGASTPSTQSSFGGTAFANKPIFGQSIFGQSGTSIFGGGSSSESTASIFGGNSAGSTNAFQGAGSFSSTPAGSFSANAGSVAQSGFGTSSAFPKPAGGFGNAPVFGTAAGGGGFGGAATFGGSPSFGTQSAFGSPQKVFGSTSPQPNTSFGQNQGSPAFESIATQNTVGFGSLAQMSGSPTFVTGFSPQPAPPSTFGSNQSSFGGSSFSSWR